MKILVLLMLPVTLLLAGENPFSAGERAFEEGRFDDALETFTLAERSEGDEASSALLINKSLTALRASRLVEAEIAAEKAAVRGGPGLFGLRYFLLGNAAYARCELAELRASGPEAEPFAFDLAIAQAEKARLFWQRAAVSRTDWPEARRNVERALLKAEALKRKKEAARMANRKKKEERRPEPEPRTEPSDAADRAKKSEEEVQADPQLDELSPQLVKRLLRKLNEKEQEKYALRRAEQRARRTEVERDW